jgi:hypothetical protein
VSIELRENATQFPGESASAPWRRYRACSFSSTKTTRIGQRGEGLRRLQEQHIGKPAVELPALHQFAIAVPRTDLTGPKTFAGTFIVTADVYVLYSTRCDARDKMTRQGVPSINFAHRSPPHRLVLSYDTSAAGSETLSSQSIPKHYHRCICHVSRNSQSHRAFSPAIGNRCLVRRPQRSRTALTTIRVSIAP